MHGLEMPGSTDTASPDARYAAQSNEVWQRTLAAKEDIDRRMWGPRRN